MDKITNATCLALFLVCSNNASASLMSYTDVAAGDNALLLSLQQWSTNQFSVDVEVVHTEMSDDPQVASLFLEGVLMDSGWFEDWMIDSEHSVIPPSWDMPYFEHTLELLAGHYPYNIDRMHHHQHVPAVPLPAAVWLFGSGLIGLAGFARKKS